MIVVKLGQEEQLKTGCSHLAVIDYADLSAAATSKVLTLYTYGANEILERGQFDLTTKFDGGATSELTIKVGWNGASVDDDDGLIAAASIHADATTILCSRGTGSGLATQEAGTIEATFTATGANTSVLTAGKLRVYFNVVKLADLRGINAI